MADKHKTFVSFMQHTMLLYVLFVHAITLNAHEPEEFWWHPNAMDVDYLMALDVDSLQNALENMSNPDSIFYATIDLIKRYHINKLNHERYILSSSLYNSLAEGRLLVQESKIKQTGLQILSAEYEVMLGNVETYSSFGYNDFEIQDLSHPVYVGFLYFGIKAYMRIIGLEYQRVNEGIKRAYYAAKRMNYWEPLGELAGWMLIKGEISTAEFLQVYEQLPPRPKSYALIYYVHTNQMHHEEFWQYREMYRLGGSSNIFGQFRGAIELATRMIETSQLDSAEYYLEKARLASQKMNDLEVEYHLEVLQHRYYNLMGDSVQAQTSLSRKKELDSLFYIPQYVLSGILSKNLAKDLQVSERRLSERNNQLYVMIGVLGSLMLFLLGLFIQIIRQRTQLRRANDDKAMLYGMIAHDLRSPLAALDSVIQQEGTREDMQHSVRNYARKLQFLLDDMLKWTFDQRQQLKPQPSTFDLVELVEENHHLLAQVLAEKSIAVQWDMEQEVVMYADREMISTCVRNMLQNAVKHSDTGSQITIRCYEENSMSVLEIDNEGSLSQRGGRSLGLQLIQSFSRLNNCRFSLKEQDGKVVAGLSGPTRS